MADAGLVRYITELGKLELLVGFLMFTDGIDLPAIAQGASGVPQMTQSGFMTRKLVRGRYLLGFSLEATPSEFDTLWINPNYLVAAQAFGA